MKRVCISLAAALALAVPSLAQSAEETPFSCEVRTKYNQPGTSYSSLATAVAAYTWNDNTQSDWAEASEHVAISGGTFSQKPDDALLDPDFVLVENQDGTFGVASAYVASIGDVKYADFNSFITAFQAIAASETPTTVTLLADLTGDRAVPGVVPVVAGQNIVFDLNGHTMETTLKEAGRHHYAIDNSGTLTIKDSSTEQTGTIRARGVENLGNGKLTIESGTIVSVDANGGACIWNEADVTVKGGTFTTEFEGTPSDEFGPGCLNNSGTALVTGGTFHNVNRRTYAIISNTGSIEITPAEGSEVTVFGAHGGLAVDGGTAVVNGGSYSSSDYYGLYVSNDGLGEDPMQAAVTVNGGTFDGKSYSVWVGSDYNDPVNSTIAIKGGTFLKPLHRQDVSRPDAIQVSGGTFSEKPDNAWFADGVIPVENEDGTFGVAPGSFAAEIDGVKYLTLKEAIAAVPENGAEATTITLLDDVTSADSLTFTNGQKAILNMNGKTVTFTSGKLQLRTATSLTLTGKGALVCQASGTGAISIYGNETSQIDLLVDSGVTVDGHYGIALFGNASPACRNVTVTVKGTVKTSEGGSALYVNGTVNDLEGPVPQITLTEGATVEAASVGIYAAGYAKWDLAGTINAAYAITIKSGDFNITGGSYNSTGEFKDPSEANSNGTENTGAAISITTNPDYAQKTNVTITGGTFTSTNGYAFYEGIAVKDGQPIAEASSAVIAIQGGDFTGNADLGADIAITTAENKQVVSGGTFAKPVDLSYCADGYISEVNAETGTYGVTGGTYVAAIETAEGVAGYEALQEAFDAATEGQTVTLIADVDCSDTGVKVGKTVTFDLNGRTLSLANIGTGNLNIAAGATLTLVDSTDTEKKGTGSGKIVATHDYADGYGYGIINVSDGATFVMESGLIDTEREDPVNKGQFGVMVAETGKATINGGHIRAGWYAVAGNGNDKTEPGTTIVVNGGILESTADYAIYHPQAGTLTIAGGTVAGAAGGLSINRGTATITGGTVTSQGTGDTGTWPDGTSGQGNAAITVGAKYGDVALAISGEAVITAPDGIPAISVPESDKAQAIAISGGTFSEKPDNAWFADDFIPVENEDGTFGVAPGSFAAEIAGEKYLTLQEAFDAATEGQTVTLIADVDCSDTGVKVGKTVTFDLNGRTLSLANANTGNLNIGAGATLTLKDSTDAEKKGTGAGKIVATHDYASGYGYGIINVSDGAAFVMESGLIDTVREDPVNKGQFGVMVSKTGKATINGGHIRAGWYAIAGNGNDNVAPGTTIVVNGGILESTADYAIYHPQAGTLTIAGGTVAGAAGGLSINRGSATITGGTVTSEGTGNTGEWGDGTSGQGNAAITVGAEYGDVALAISGDAVITAPDGIPAISVPESSKAQNIAISGGTFSEKPDNAWFAEGFIPVENENGTFGVIAGSFAAEIAGVKYLTLQEAFDAATEGQTVTLIADVDCSDTGVKVGKTVTFDLNGRTLSLANANTGNLNIGAGATLTLKDSTDAEKKGTGSGKIVATHDYASGYGYGIINVSDGAAFVMESGLIDTEREDPVNKGQFGVMVAETGKATINGGHIRAGWYAIAGNGNDKTEPGTTIVVNGGILESTADYAIYHPQAGTLSIAGGTVAGAAGGLSINRGTATITGGTVTSKDTGDTGEWGDGTSGQSNAAITVGAEYGDVALAISGDAVITAPKGVPAISVPESDKAQNITISGGTFSEKPDNAWFAEGFIPVENENGTFGVATGSFAAEIAGVKYLTLQEAFAAVPANGAEATTITLLDDVTSAGSLTFTNGQKAILNMNGKTVTFTSGKLQLLTSASLTLTGEGALVCQSSDTGAISIYGNETSQIDLLVDSGVTVDGHYGIALFGNNGSPACRNVTVTVKGTVKTSEGGTALYVNGTVNDLEGPVPQITLAEGATVEAVSVGIYAAGYAKWDLAGTINAAYAITIKSGDFNITGGSYTSTGDFKEPSEANSNGTEDTGAAISITTNPDYAQKTNVTITGGTFTSANGYAFYEGIAVKDGQPIAEASSAVIAIQGGDFTGNADLGADIAITTASDKQVVSGGTFSQPVALAYCAPGYIPVVGTDGKYTVDDTAIAAVANPEAQGAYLGYGTLAALVEATANGTEVLIVKYEALGEEVNLLKTATGGDNAASGAAAYDVAETLGGTFKVKNGAIVYAYQLGIADVRASGSDITVVVRLEEDGAAVTRELAGRKVRVVSGETLLAEKDAFFEEGDVTLEFTNDADVLEFAIEVLSEAEAETPAE